VGEEGRSEEILKNLKSSALLRRACLSKGSPLTYIKIELFIIEIGLKYKVFIKAYNV
jgi:hypothetical protein